MGISWQQLLILAVIVALVFGTKRLRNLGSDLGTAIRGFKKGLKEEEEPEPKLEADPPAGEAEVTEAEVTEAKQTSHSEQ